MTTPTFDWAEEFGEPAAISPGVRHGTGTTEHDVDARAALFVDHATRYAELRYALVHCDGKVPKPRAWETTKPEQPTLVAGKWSQFGKRWNLGVVCGPSGVAVLDVDRDNADAACLELLGTGELPATPTVRTGSGRLQVYYADPGGLQKRARDGFELRVGPHQCIAPPSVHPDTGRPYEWLPGRAPWEVALAELPATLVAYFGASTNGKAAAGPVGDAIGAGGRNATLTSLAGTMRRRGMSESEILAALQVANAERCKPPLETAEVARIAASIATKTPATPPRGQAAAETTDGSRSSVEEERKLDDIGNASRFARQHNGQLRYVPAWHAWLRWDGRRWAEDDVLEHLRRAQQTSRDTSAELARAAAEEQDDQRRKELLGWAKRLGAEPRIRSMLALGASDERLVITPSALDPDPWTLNCLNGSVDLRSSALRAHSAGDLLTKLAGAAYDPAAAAPTWHAHLERVLPDPEMRAFLQRLAGLSAIGVVREHVLPLLVGGGANGKTSTRNAIAGALGDYAGQSSTDLLLRGRRGAGQATPEIADLRGLRLVTVSETPEDGQLAGERAKAITGGDELTARRLHGNPFTFTPSHTVWVLTNHRPRVPDDGHAMWRRILLLHFGVTIPESEQDRDLEKKLAGESAGVLRWIVDGARIYLEQGLNPPDTVTAATAKYRDEEDLFGSFLAECTVDEPDASAKASELLAAHKTWAERTGAPALSRNALAEKLTSRGYQRLRVESGSRWYGLRPAQEGTLDG